MLFSRLAVLDASSRVRIAATVSALGMSNIPMNYIGEEPQYLTGSLYLGFPNRGGAGKNCQLPLTAEQLMDALPDAVFLQPDGGDILRVWPSTFVLEVFGTKVSDH